MLSVKQGDIKYHFFSLWYDSTWDWTPVSQAFGEHSTSDQLNTSILLIYLSHGIYTADSEYRGMRPPN